MLEPIESRRVSTPEKSGWPSRSRVEKCRLLKKRLLESIKSRKMPTPEKEGVGVDQESKNVDF
jgi:hypothetical protein